jgi:hypothetical protein
MTSNKALSMLSALAAFAFVAAITFNGYGVNRPAPVVTVGQR